MTTRANEYQIGGSHYSQAGNYQHWNFVEDFRIGYLESLATKYLVRWDKKGIPVQDLQKALHTVDRLLEAINGERRLNRAEPIPEKEIVGLFCSANKIPNIDVCRAIELLYCWRSTSDVQHARDLIARLLDAQPSQRILKEYDAGGKKKKRVDGQEHPFGYDATAEGVTSDVEGKETSSVDQKVWETPGASGPEDRKDSEAAGEHDSSGSDRGAAGSI